MKQSGRMSKWRWLLLGATAVIGTTAAAGIAANGFDVVGHNDSTHSHEITLQDRTPIAVINAGGGSVQVPGTIARALRPDSLRLATSGLGMHAFTGVGVFEGRPCLMVSRMTDPTVAVVACDEPDAFARRGIYVATDNEDGSRDVAWRLPPGLTRVTDPRGGAAPPNGGVALFRAPKGKTQAVAHGGGQVVSLPFDDMTEADRAADELARRAVLDEVNNP